MWTEHEVTTITFHKSVYIDCNYLLASPGKRFILSEAYRCQEAWQNRLQTPTIQNINLDELFNDLESKYLQEGKASAIDVDLVRNIYYASDGGCIPSASFNLMFQSLYWIPTYVSVC